jgi:hypothetical protein
MAVDQTFSLSDIEQRILYLPVKNAPDGQIECHFHIEDRLVSMYTAGSVRRIEGVNLAFVDRLRIDLVMD